MRINNKVIDNNKLLLKELQTKEEESKKKAQEFEWLNNLGIDLISSLSLKEICSKGLQSIYTKIGADLIAFYLYDSLKDNFLLYDIKESNQLVNGDLPKSENKFNKTIEEEIKKRKQLKTILTVKLTHHTRQIGYIIIGWREDINPDEKVFLIEAAKTHFLFAIDNALLYDKLQNSYQELLQTQQELIKKEKLATLGELSSIIAHEIRNPLGTILNSISQVAKRIPSDFDQNVLLLLSIAKEEINRLNKLVVDLLQFARPGDPLFNLYNLDELIKEAIKIAKQDEFYNDKIVIEFESQFPVHEVYVDGERLRNVMINLIVNAIQSIEKEGNIKITNKLEKKSIKITIQDNGKGIEERIITKIFDPFFSTKPSGTGLGLSIVKRLLEDRGGNITVISKENEGSTFTILLPYQTEID